MTEISLDPVLVDLATLLRCPDCTAEVAATATALSCTRCGRQMPIVDGVPQIRASAEDAALERERQAVLHLEAGAPSDVPPDSTHFGLPVLLAGPCPQRTAFLSLPYDDGSAFYRDNDYFRGVAVFGPAFDYVVDRLGLAPGSRVLDIGADLTWSTSRLARRGWRAVGIDINHHLVASRVFREAGIHYAVANLDMHLPAFADGVFDGVTAFNALHHTHRLEPLIANIARMVRPGGRLGFVEPFWFLEAERATFGAAQIEAGINENVHRLEEWHAVLVNHGFELRACATGHALQAVYERVSAGRERHLTVDQARDEFFAPFYRAALSLPGQGPLCLSPGTSTTVPVHVVNLSDRTWSEVSQVPVHLSYHLLSAGDGPPASRMFRFDNDRSGIGGDLHPGADRIVPVRVTAPATPGRYDVVIDLVHEGVTWFADRQQPTALLRLDVTS